jgi:prepilin-type N-terminal cleavage/methylation domain-containing protein
MTKGNKRMRHSRQLSQMSGLTLLELLVAMAVIAIITGIAIPNFNTALHTARLRGGESDFASLVQVARIRAVDDDRYYSIYVFAANGNTPQQGFVDIFPQNINGASGSNGTVLDPRDPLVQINGEVLPQPQNAAPNTAALRALILPANSPVVVQDGSAAGSPVTFGPRGLPCTPFATVGGAVCDSQGVGPTAYWIFLQNNISQKWGAITVTPAGRIQRWLFSGAPGNTWNQF